MPTYIIKLREGPDIAVEGAALQTLFKEGCDVPLIVVVGPDNSKVAAIPSDAVRVVYQKDAEKEPE